MAASALLTKSRHHHHGRTPRGISVPLHTRKGSITCILLAPYIENVKCGSRHAEQGVGEVSGLLLVLN